MVIGMVKDVSSLMVKKIAPKAGVILNNGSEPSEQYEVGFKKPPKQTRFAKGQSGNPSGRPKGSKNLATILMTQAMQLVTVTERGQSRQVTKLEAVMTQLFNKAAVGDFASARLVMQVMPSMEAQFAKAGIPALSHEHDQQVLKVLLDRMKQSEHAQQIEPTQKKST